MSKYQCGTMGEYARLLTEDIEHAVRGEYRTPEGKWEEDPELDPVEEAGGAARELSHHLFMLLTASNAMEALSGLEIGKNLTMRQYAEAHAVAEQEIADDWEWLYADDVEELDWDDE